MASKVYINTETAVSWKVSGGDEAVDLGGTDGAADGVSVGSYHDWGAAPRSNRFLMFVDVDGFDTAPVIGETVDIYLTESEDATLWTGPEAPSNTTHTAGDTNILKNLKRIGPVVVRSTTAGDNLVAAFTYHSDARYSAPVVHNNTADKLLSTADAHEIRIYPVPFEGQ